MLRIEYYEEIPKGVFRDFCLKQYPCSDCEKRDIACIHPLMLKNKETNTLSKERYVLRSNLYGLSGQFKFSAHTFVLTNESLYGQYWRPSPEFLRCRRAMHQFMQEHPLPSELEPSIWGPVRCGQPHSQSQIFSSDRMLGLPPHFSLRSDTPQSFYQSHFTGEYWKLP
jgi:hypothetical protein